MGEIKTFTDLNSWKESHKLVLLIYNSIQEHSAVYCGDELNADMSSSFGGIPRSLERGGCHKLTNKFPAKEDYALTSQMRRASVSITSNIAEGFSRRGKKEKMLFYSMSLGSVTELQSQLLVARDVEYINIEEYKLSINQTVVVHKLINGLIKGVANLHNT